MQFLYSYCLCHRQQFLATIQEQYIPANLCCLFALSDDYQQNFYDLNNLSLFYIKISVMCLVILHKNYPNFCHELVNNFQIDKQKLLFCVSKELLDHSEKKVHCKQTSSFDILSVRGGGQR